MIKFKSDWLKITKTRISATEILWINWLFIRGFLLLISPTLFNWVAAVQANYTESKLTPVNENLK